MLSELPSEFPKIRGLLWFDKEDDGPGGHADWSIESSSDSLAARRRVTALTEATHTQEQSPGQNTPECASGGGLLVDNMLENLVDQNAVEGHVLERNCVVPNAEEFEPPASSLAFVCPRDALPDHVDTGDMLGASVEQAGRVAPIRAAIVKPVPGDRRNLLQPVLDQRLLGG